MGSFCYTITITITITGTGLVAVFGAPAQVARRAAGPAPHLAEVAGGVADDRDVPDLAAGPDLFAGEVHLDRRIRRHHVDVPVVDVRVGAAEQVRHHGERT